MCSTARGSSTRLSLVCPTKFKASWSFLHNEGSLKVEIKEHLVDFVATLSTVFEYRTDYINVKTS